MNWNEAIQQLHAQGLERDAVSEVCRKDQAMTTEQPYFMVKVTRCGECTFGRYELCRIEPFEKYGRFLENYNGITPTCPMWPQRVQFNQQEKS